MNNKVIKVLNKKHGRKVIKFWKKYCNTKGFIGTDIGGYYGIIGGKFNVWQLDDIILTDVEVIELPEEKTYPRVMLVSHNNIDWNNRRVVFMEKCGGYLAWANVETIEEAEKERGTGFWKYAKEIESIEVTIEEIAEWKGVSKELINIKK